MLLTILLLHGLAASVVQAGTPVITTNSLGMKMIVVSPGAYQMGSDGSHLPESLGGPLPDRRGDWDEYPQHQVVLTTPFRVSETEVTIEQYRQFRVDHQDSCKFSPYVSGLSWEDAVGFCQWLSEKEKQPYRLPTEAEWEYLCRTGTTTWFSSGEQLPNMEVPNPWGIKNLHTGVAEWCQDWYGPYPEEGLEQVDPIGLQTGIARVVRGGSAQDHSLVTEVGNSQPYYHRSANRAGAPPQYRGAHLIGFRVVQAVQPTTTPIANPESTHPLQMSCVKQTELPVKAAPNSEKSHFKKRRLLPIPPENLLPSAIAVVGLAPGIQGHNHSPGIVVCSNGDLLVSLFSSTASHKAEYWPNVGLIALRLRYGAEEWDFPTPFVDLPDMNDGPVSLWNDQGTIHAFMGGLGLVEIPFRWCTSKDNGATWDTIKLPILTGPIGGYYPQPINPPFRGPDGSIYLPMDGLGPRSLLWKSSDEGLTWSDTGGRAGGRHTVFALLSDNRILGMGGKGSNIDGYMPKSTSTDWGKSYVVSKTPFAPLSSNQRPSLLKLKSGNLFFAGDFQNFEGNKPDRAGAGSYVALSKDEGETWHIKRLAEALPHESQVLDLPENWSHNKHGEATLGYSAVCQSPNGLIHLITTMNHPCLHLEMNEAWIMSETESSSSQSLAIQSEASSQIRIISGEEHYPGGNLKGKWEGMIGAEGSFQLNGTECWFYPDGNRQWEVTWEQGRKTGEEKCWRSDGTLDWAWSYPKAGPHLWTRWWRNGTKRSESSWLEGRCTGIATCWDVMGHIESQVTFTNGSPVSTQDLK